MHSYGCTLGVLEVCVHLWVYAGGVGGVCVHSYGCALGVLRGVCA